VGSRQTPQIFRHHSMASGARKAAITGPDLARRDFDVGCASATSSPALTAEQMPICQTVVAVSKALTAIRANIEASHEPQPVPEIEASVGKRRVARGEHIQEAGTDASPVTRVTGDRPSDDSAGQHTLSEVLPAIATLPAEAALLQLALLMLTGGSGAPAAPAERYEPAEATLELLVLVWSVVTTLKKQHAGSMHIVPGTNGRIDAEESRGFLLGAVLGRGLLTREQAAAAGLDARNKKKAVEKRLADEKEIARKAARKLSADALEQHAVDTATARAALERAPIVLELPPPPPPPKLPSAAGRKRAAPPAVEPFEVRWQRWCEKQRISDMPEHCEWLQRRKGEEAWELRRWEQAWKPRTWHGRLELSRLTERGHTLNRELCTCSEGVPSWLCRVWPGATPSKPRASATLKRCASIPASANACAWLRHGVTTSSTSMWLTIGPLTI
jgi:hypothetical protein